MGRGHVCASAKAGRRRLARRNQRPSSLFPSKPFAAALDGELRQTPVALKPCGVLCPHAGELDLAWFSRVGMAGLEPAASRPPAARATNCATFRRTPAGTRTRIDGFGDRRAADCTIDAKGGVHDAATSAARPSMSRTPPKSPEPDSDRRPAAYEAAALPLGHRGVTVPPIAFSMYGESLSARVPCRARHGRNRLVEPAGFGPATFPLRTGCAASAPRPHAGPPLCGKDRPEKESFRWRRYAAGALGRIRTGDAHLRRVALYPLSYGGKRRPASAWAYAPAALIPYP